MKLIKDPCGIYRYVTEDRQVRVSYCYPSLSVCRKFWEVESNISGNKIIKYFKKLDEVKEYVNNL